MLHRIAVVTNTLKMCVKWASVSLQIWYHCFNDYDTLFLDVYFKLRSSTELIVELNSCCYKKVDDSGLFANVFNDC